MRVPLRLWPGLLVYRYQMWRSMKKWSREIRAGEPRTKAGRALLEALQGNLGPDHPTAVIEALIIDEPYGDGVLRRAIHAIEQEAAAPPSEKAPGVA